MSDKEVVVCKELLTTMFLLGLIGIEELIEVCVGVYYRGSK